MKKLISILVICMIGLTGCTSQTTWKEPEKKNADDFYLAGKVQASEGADLSVPFTGKVEKVFVKVGQTVKAGDSLVLFDTSESDAQGKISEEALQVAIANLEKAKIGARPEQLLQAEATKHAAQVAKDNAEQNLERQKAVYEMGSISLAELEAAEGQAASAEAALKNATEAYEILKNGETKAYLSVLEKQVAQAQAAVDSAKVSLGNKTIKAPFEGTIISLVAKKGETYVAQTTLLSLENRSRLTLDAYGPTNVIEKFKAGEKVKIRISDLNNEVKYGSVVWVGNSVDVKRRDVLVKISLEPSTDILAGMLAEVAPMN